MSKFLDSNGVLYLWGKIKTLLGGKVDKVEGKGLSANDFTTPEKEKLAGLENYTLPEATAEKLGGVKVGAGLSITGGVLSATGGGSGGGSGSAEEVYSTEETRIGTWIDGKPLYRKVFQVTCPPAGPYQVVIPASDLPNMRIKRIDGYLYSNSNPSGGPINFAYSRAYIATWNYAGAIYMETNNADYANSPAEIIFEYTKTTD